MNLLFVSNKSLIFDTRVKRVQEMLKFEISESSTYLDLFCPFDKKLSQILYCNLKLLKMLFLDRKDLLGCHIAYAPDLLSVFKIFVFILAGGKFVLDVHDYDFDRAPHGIKKYSINYHLQLVLLVFAAKRAKAVLTVSKLMSRFLRRYYQVDRLNIFCLYNTFGAQNCSCNFSLVLKDLESADFLIGLVGSRSRFRGSDDLLNAIINVCNSEKVSLGKIKIIWFGGGASNSNIPIFYTNFNHVEFVTTPLLCQRCLIQAVAQLDVAVHAYNRRFANARHAVPNKLFSFLTGKPKNIIYSGDLECRKLLLDHYPHCNASWFSSHMDWDHSLCEIDTALRKVISFGTHNVDRQIEPQYNFLNSDFENASINETEFSKFRVFIKKDPF